MQFGRNVGQCGHLRAIIAAGGLIFVMLSTTDAREWRLRADGSGDVPTIVAAIDSAAAGDTLRLSAGVYLASVHGVVGDRTAYIVPRRLAIIGAGADSTTLDGEGNRRIAIALDTLFLSRVTIQNGYAPIQPSAGVTMGSGGTVKSCRFINNYAFDSIGGALAVENGEVADCEFIGNGTFGSGGAVILSGGSVRRCRFLENYCVGDPSGRGGALWMTNSEVVDSYFERNSAVGLFGGRGGAVWAELSRAERCIFIDNQAVAQSDGVGQGGALALALSTALECMFFGNEVVGDGDPGGGAIYAFTDRSIISHCTLLGNSSGVIGATVDHSLVVDCRAGPAFADAAVACIGVWQNPIPDTNTRIQGPMLLAEPRFCSGDPIANRDVSLRADSPFAVYGDCGLVGAAAVRCGVKATERRSWGELKRVFRGEKK